MGQNSHSGYLSLIFILAYRTQDHVHLWPIFSLMKSFDWECQRVPRSIAIILYGVVE